MKNEDALCSLDSQVIQALQADVHARSYDNAANFASEVLGLTLDEWQEAALHAISYRDRVAIRCTNGGGKTGGVAAPAVLWFLNRYKPSKVITTASTWLQVETQLWTEILRYKEKAGLPGSTTKTSITISDDHFALGLSTDEEGRFEGFHSEHVMILIDEAKSVSPAIFRACERILSTGAVLKMLVVSTPAGKSGPFFECFTKRRQRFVCFHVPAVPQPESTPYYAPRVDRKWITEVKEDFGEDSPFYHSAVLAEFSDEAQNAAIPMRFVEKAVMQYKADATAGTKDEKGTPLDAFCKLGVDVAHSVDGDESTLYVVRGNRIVDFIAKQTIDIMAVCGFTVQLMTKWAIEPQNVYVDAGGGYGSGVIDTLKERGVRVNGVNNGASARRADLFSNLAAEMWWRTRQKFEKGLVAVPDDPKLISQLTTRLWMEPDSKGRMVLEPKKKMKERGLKSPDRADGLILAMSCEKRAYAVQAFLLDGEDGERAEDGETPGDGANRAKQAMREAELEAEATRADAET